MKLYLKQEQVLLKDFAKYAAKVSTQVREASVGAATNCSRPHIYLPSSQENQEQVALGLARKDRIEQGLVCVLGCVEPCLPFDISRPADEKAETRQPVAKVPSPVSLRD